jgi:diketogulonate reductase-like aldo/keto reductase
MEDSTMPTILYGTAWMEEQTAEMTRLAIAAGFDGVDSANQRRHYREIEVGEALSMAFEHGLCDRKNFFVQTKFTYAQAQDESLPYDREACFTTQVHQSLEQSLLQLKTSYVDSYVLHGPSSARALSPSDWEVWRAMEVLQQQGKTKMIGVSNFSLRQLKEIYTYADVKPAVIQNRCSAERGWDRDIREYCRANAIRYQGFSLLSANREELERAEIRRSSKERRRSPAQIVLGAAMQAGVVPILGTKDPVHMRDALACAEFTLNELELDLL